MSIFGIRSEHEVMRHWGSGSDLVVSVCCITFNHRAYIEQALEGFLAQETEFPFEVVVHDDASTDGTAEIVSSYARRYPTLIKAILQPVNQYSVQNTLPMITAMNACKGEFIAFCEGDDFWTSSDKLQRQVVLMRSNTDCDISFHRAEILLMEQGSKAKVLAGDYGERVRRFSPARIVAGGGGFMPSVSLMFRSRIRDSFPAWLASAPIGDYFVQALGALRGGALYSPETSAVYRKGTLGGWTTRSAIQSVRVRQVRELVSYLDKFGDLLGGDLSKRVGILRFKVLAGFALDDRIARKEKVDLIKDARLRTREIAMLYVMLLLPKSTGSLSRGILSRLERALPVMRGRFRS